MNTVKVMREIGMTFEWSQRKEERCTCIFKKIPLEERAKYKIKSRKNIFEEKKIIIEKKYVVKEMSTSCHC